jgi:hypothetical protein
MAEAPCVGRAVVLRGGDKTQKLAIIYTRCVDELYAKAELLKVLDDVNQRLSIPINKIVIGIYDIDPTFSVAEFKRGYHDRPGDRATLRRHYNALRRDPQAAWPFLEVVLPPVAGFRRPGLARLSHGMEDGSIQSLVDMDQADGRHASGNA